jgi:hypothetical protein
MLPSVNGRLYGANTEHNLSLNDKLSKGWVTLDIYTSSAKRTKEFFTKLAVEKIKHKINK